MNDSFDFQIILPQSGHLSPVTVIKEIEGLVFSGDASGKICIWDKSFDFEIGFLKAHSSSITDIAFFPYFSSIITSSQGLNLRFWSLSDFSLIDTIKVHGAGIINIEFLSGHILTGGRDRILKQWSFLDGKIKLVKQIRIPYLEEFYVFDDKILISCSDGSIFIYDSNFKLVTYLTLKRAKLISAIRKSGKYIKSYKKDPYTIFTLLEGVRGLPVTCFSFDDNFLYLGHFYGFITVWRKKDFKLSDVFVSHDKNITAIDVFNGKVITVSLDSKLVVFDTKKDHPVIFPLANRPLSLLRLSNNNLAIGFDNGLIKVYDSKMNEITEKVPVQIITCCCVTPNFILAGTNKGYVKRYSIQSLEEITPLKISSYSILGIFYYDSMIAIIDSDSILRVLNSDTDLTEIESLSIPLKKEELKLKGYNRYIVLSANMIFDFKKIEIMRGEVSSTTKNRYSEAKLYTFSFETGNIILNINKDKLLQFLKKEDYSIYPEEILRNLKRITEVGRSAFKQLGESTWVKVDKLE